MTDPQAHLSFDADLPGLRAALDGQYVLVRELGRGGMGIVLEARDLKLDRRVALKVLPRALATQPATRERFLREARLAAQLSHPHVVPIFRADELGGFAFFAMGLVEGESLGARVAARGPLPAAEAVKYLREAAWALAYAHARGVVHRDVKPENLLVERASGRVLVTDFGIARSEEASRLTQTGHVMGSVHWMSPEQGAGDAHDGRSAVYALGAVGFFLLAGRPPFEHESAAAILVARATKDAPALSSVAPGVPAALARVIDRCLMRDPAQRPATGEALADDLAAALAAAEEVVSAASGPQAVLSEREAQAVWQRAAQLQAEAASRLEARAKQSAALPATRGASPDGMPTSGFRLRDVEAAAIEAGISQQYVAVAMDELQSRAVVTSAPSARGVSDRLSQRVLGSARRQASTTQVIHAPAAQVLQTMGQVLQGAKFNLRLAETLGGHPLDGGVLVFDVPDMTGLESQGYAWAWLRYQGWVRQVRATIRAVPGDSSRCEVTLSADLTTGRPAALLESGAATAVSGGLAALLGAALQTTQGATLAASRLGWIVTALQSLGLHGRLGAALAAGTLGAVAGYAVLRWLYGFGLRKADAELREATAAIAVELRKAAVFIGDPFAPMTRPPPGSGGGSAP
ncbi:MAG: protein kinase domain-containing protein [Gemmatimonadota bacterium]